MARRAPPKNASEPSAEPAEKRGRRTTPAGGEPPGPTPPEDAQGTMLLDSSLVSAATPTAANVDGLPGGQRQLSHWFIGAFLVGLGGELLSLWWVPGLAIFGYFLIGARLTSQMKNTERFGDSLYYLGFILTIWALIFSLGPFRSTDLTLKSSEVILQFGIALTSTAVGMTLRIWLLQRRHTLVDQDEESSETVARLVAAVVKELEGAVQAVAAARLRMSADMQGTAKSLSDQVVALGAQARSELASTNAEYVQQLRKYAEDVVPALTSLAQRLQAIDLPEDIIAARLEEAVGRVTAEIGDMQRRLQSSAGGFAGSFDESARQLQDGLTRLSQMVEEANAAGRRNAELSMDMGRANMQLVERFTEATTESTNATKTYTRVAQDMANAVQSLHSRLQSDVSAYEERLHTGADRLETAVRNASAKVEDLEELIGEGTDLLHEIAGNYEKAT